MLHVSRVFVPLEDYIVVVVWGTLALEQLNATTTTVEDYMRGQLPLDKWTDAYPGETQCSS